MHSHPKFLLPKPLAVLVMVMMSVSPVRVSAIVAAPSTASAPFRAVTATAKKTVAPKSTAKKQLAPVVTSVPDHFPIVIAQDSVCAYDPDTDRAKITTTVKTVGGSGWRPIDAQSGSDGILIGSTLIDAASSQPLVLLRPVTAVAGQIRADLLISKTYSLQGTCPDYAPGEPPPASASAREQVARSMATDEFDRTNAERAVRGLSLLAWDDRLQIIADEWAIQMKSDGFSHRPSAAGRYAREGLPGGGRAENILMSATSISAATINESLMRSPGHRANKLNTLMNAMGVGIYCADDGSVWAVENYWGTDYRVESPPEEPRAQMSSKGSPTCPIPTRVRSPSNSTHL